MSQIIDSMIITETGIVRILLGIGMCAILYWLLCATKLKYFEDPVVKEARLKMQKEKEAQKKNHGQSSL